MGVDDGCRPAHGARRRPQRSSEYAVPVLPPPNEETYGRPSPHDGARERAPRRDRRSDERLQRHLERTARRLPSARDARDAHPPRPEGAVQGLGTRVRVDAGASADPADDLLLRDGQDPRLVTGNRQLRDLRVHGPDRLHAVQRDRRRLHRVDRRQQRSDQEGLRAARGLPPRERGRRPGQLPDPVRDPHRRDRGARGLPLARGVDLPHPVAPGDPGLRRGDRPRAVGAQRLPARRAVRHRRRAHGAPLGVTDRLLVLDGRRRAEGAVAVGDLHEQPAHPVGAGSAERDLDPTRPPSTTHRT